MFEATRIVLVNTTHPGNIGSVARAMKTMGLTNLYLVSPKLFPSQKANELAAHADDVLEQATVVESLSEALSGCRLVMGTSARPREINLPGLNPRQAAERCHREAQQHDVAIVFGQEKSGLSNEQLSHCHYHIYIPSNPDYSSLNLAMAVQVICYELRMAQAEISPEYLQQHDEFSTSDDVERFYQHFEQVLIKIEFLDPEHPKRHMQRMRRLFNRIRLEKMETNLWRGVLSAIEYNMREADTREEA